MTNWVTTFSKGSCKGSYNLRFRAWGLGLKVSVPARVPTRPISSSGWRERSQKVPASREPRRP